jgi:hypothetical protein
MAKQHDLFEIQEGRRRAEEGMERSWTATSEEWRDVAWDTLIKLANSGKPFNSDDIKERIGPPDHPNAVGSLFSKASRRGIIEVVGMRPMRGAKAHARMTFLYIGIKGND